MKYTETRIIYEDSCWFCPQYKWFGMWWNYETFRYNDRNSVDRARFLTLEEAQNFIKTCRKYNIYKGPK